MKSHTSEFKEEIKTLGKQQSVKITYKENNVTKTLTDEDINSATPNYEASLLKSVMKVLELDSNVSIPKGTEIKFEYGLLVNGAYEYLNYGNYIVAKEPEKQEDTLSYKITCYDKMLYSMKDYEHVEIPYPCTIKQYLVALCNKIGLQFKDSDFANANRQITSELFMTINEDGTYSSMGYTYRDVLDQIAETTGGCICITLDDKVEVRYINKELEYSTSKNTNEVEIETQVKEKVKTINIDGNSYQETTEGYNLLNVPAEYTILSTEVYKKVPISLKANHTYTIKIGQINTDNTDVTSILFRFMYNEVDISDTYAYVKLSDLKTVYTVASDVDAVLIYSGDSYAQGAKTNTTYKNLMIYEGTEDKPYEPYTGGIPSPSPDYPQDIEVINNHDTENKYNLQEGHIGLRQSGKNLIGLDIQQYKVDLKAGDKITIQNKTTEQLDLWLYTNYGDTGRNDYWTIKGNAIRTITVAKDTKAIRWNFTVNGIAWCIKGEYSLSTIPKYKPYHEPIITPINLQGNILSKIGDVKDILKINRNGEVEIKKNIGKVVLDGTENWQQYKNFIYLYIENAVNIVSSVDIPDIKSNMFRPIQFNNISSSPDNSITYNLIGNSNKHKGISFYTNKYFNDVSTIKSWLAAQKEAGTPVIVYYELATPQIITLPSISPIELWQGTNIFSLVTNLDTEIELEYPTNYDTIDEEYINDTNVNFGEKYRAY